MNLDQIFKEFPRFYSWSQQKKLTETDLSILTEFSSSQKIRPLIEWIETHHVSHSQAVQILELGGELLLMNESIQSLLEQHKLALSLIESLKKLRYPKHTAQQEKKINIIKQLELSKFMKAKTLQHQDKTGLHIEFTSFSLKDFKQKLQKLNFIYTQLEQKRLWKH